jgi:hypothetical protein
MQALSNDVETLGLTDVALGLKFAMDVYLREKGLQTTANTAVSDSPVQQNKPAPPKSTFLLAQVYRQAS